MQAWVIGNWKQHPVTLQAVDELLEQMVAQLPKAGFPNCQLMVIPGHLHLAAASDRLSPTAIAVGTQDICAFSGESGAFTGDCSAAQVQDAGASWVLVGHSERRQYYSECNERLRQKVIHALHQQLGVIFCIGETQADYESGQTLRVLEAQLMVIKDVLVELADSEDLVTLDERLIIAYEPVWAIGTGKVPTVNEVSEVHAHIKQLVKSFDDREVIMDSPSVVYGGSVNQNNATQFAQSDMIDGALVGGASLKAESFLAIASAFSAAKSHP